MEKTKNCRTLIVGLVTLGFCMTGMGTRTAQAYYSFVRNGERSHWAVPSVTLTVDHTVDGIDCTTPPTGDFLAISDAIDTWNTVAAPEITLVFACSATDYVESQFDAIPEADDIFLSGASSPYLVSVGGINEVVFDDTANGDIILDVLGTVGIDPAVFLGLAFPYDAAGNIIADTAFTNPMVEAFVLLNASDVLTNSSTSIDYQAVMTHEIGHLLGLGHTPSLNRGQNAESLVPTMYAVALSDQTQSRSLESDDVAGIAAGYLLSAAASLGYGSISGEVTTSSGTSLVGAALIAQRSSGDEISVIIGGNPDLDDTHYRIDGVPAGDYVVQLLPLNGSTLSGQTNSGSSGSIDAIFVTPPYNFTPLYFDNSTLSTNATTVTVTASQDTPNIDFTGSETGGGNPSGLVGNVIQDGEGCSVSRNPNASIGFFQSSLWLYLMAPLGFIYLSQRSRRA